MSNIPLKTIKFPGLDDTYTVPVVDNTLATAGAAADAKKVGDELSDLKQDSDFAQDESTQIINVDPDSATPILWTIVSSNTWSHAAETSNARGCIIPIPSGSKKVRITFNSGGSVLAFLQDTTKAAGAAPSFSTEYAERLVYTYDGHPTYVEFHLYDDTKFMYYLASNSAGNDLRPESIQFLVHKNDLDVPTGLLSQTRGYVVPKNIHNELFIHDAYEEGETAYYNTQGICTDGENLYYALRTFDQNGVSGVSLLKKVNIASKETVLFDASPTVNYGHCEDMCYVPSFVPGFDNGSVNRLYICDFDRSPDHQSGRYIHVVNADTFEYITSFATASLFSSVTGWTGASGINYSVGRGQFIIKGGVSGDSDHDTAFIVTDSSGNLSHGILCKKNGTGVGIDCDDNFIYYVRYVSTEQSGVFDIILNVFTWNFDKVLVGSVDQVFWEIEGFCNAGNDVYCTWNEIASNRTGIDITKSNGIEKAVFGLSNGFTGWTGGVFNIVAFGDVVNNGYDVKFSDPNHDGHLILIIGS